MKNQILCQPTGEPVILLVDNLGVVTFKNPDNTPYTGDVSLLENCCCDVPHPPVVTNDSGSIDFTQSGTDNQTITAILTGADTATLDQFPASDGAGNIVWTSPLVTAARHDLRLVGTNLERGSDSATVTNGAEFLHDSYSHLAGFSDNWIGTNGALNPVQSLQNNGDIWQDANSATTANNKMASHFNYSNQSYILGRHLSSAYTDIGSLGVVIGGFQLYNNGGQANTMLGGYQNSIVGTDYGLNIGGRENQLENATYGGTVGGFSNYASGIESFIIGSQLSSTNNDRCGIIVSYNSSTGGYSAKVIGSTDSSANGDYSVAIGGANNVTNTAYQTSLGIGVIPFTGDAITMQLLDVLLSIGNGEGANRNNVFTVLKDGKAQFFNEPAGFSTRTQVQATPKAALEVVSATSGIIPPQLTDAAAIARILEINTTPSLTKALPGGWDDRIGETWFNLDLGTHERVIWNGAAYIKQTY